MGCENNNRRQNVRFFDCREVFPEREENNRRGHHCGCGKCRNNVRGERDEGRNHCGRCGNRRRGERDEGRRHGGKDRGRCNFCGFWF